MKIRKLMILCAAFMVTMAAAIPVMAQEISEDRRSEYYYVNVTLERIYPYRRGYVVLYQKSGMGEMARAYLPIEWFTDTGGRGELLYLGSGPAWPSLTVYYKNGEFSHVRLYVRRSTSHVTWGTVGPGVNIDSEFDNVDDLRLEF
jgi:hypothetical protein